MYLKGGISSAPWISGINIVVEIGRPYKLRMLSTFFSAAQRFEPDPGPNQTLYPVRRFAEPPLLPRRKLPSLILNQGRYENEGAHGDRDMRCDGTCVSSGRAKNGSNQRDVWSQMGTQGLG